MGSVFKQEDSTLITVKDMRKNNPPSRSPLPKVSVMLGVQTQGENQQIDQVVLLHVQLYYQAKKGKCEKIERKPKQFVNVERGGQDRKHVSFYEKNILKKSFLRHCCSRQPFGSRS